MRRLKVTELDFGSLGERAGLRDGDILDSYDGKSLESLPALLSAVTGATEGIHNLRVIRRDRIVELTCAAGRLGVGVAEVELDPTAYQAAMDNLALDKATDEVVLTTSHVLDGYHTEVVEVITSECVFGMNIFKDFFAAVSDVFGGRSGTTQTVLRDARKTCLEELKREAARLGANAVIAVDLDYSEFSGGGKSMLFLVASGTAVKAKKG